jgi:hypothetical protein
MTTIRRNGINVTAIYGGREWDRAVLAVKALENKITGSYRTGVPLIVKQALKRYLTTVARTVAARNSGTYPGGTTSSSLSVRTGEGIQSILNSVEVGGSFIDNIYGIIGGASYLRINEFGGVIRPRNGRYLTVPLPPALHSNGTPKKRSARDWNDTFIQRSRNGNLLIFQQRGRDIIPLYVLKEQVYIPPRLGLTLTLDQFISVFLRDVANRVRAEFRSALR